MESYDTKYGTVEELIEILKKLPRDAQISPFRPGGPEGEAVFAIRGVRLCEGSVRPQVAFDLVPDEDGSYYADPV